MIAATMSPIKANVDSDLLNLFFALKYTRAAIKAAKVAIINNILSSIQILIIKYN
jgi:hypothetical protein